jgi:hypothetical protein
MRSFSLALALFVLVATMPVAAAAGSTGSAPGRCSNGRSKTAATWYSIAHPGLGEWYLKGWGPLERAPQKKFWLGFIPIYGWPGYLQVKSAIDANHCRTNDDLRFRS